MKQSFFSRHYQVELGNEENLISHASLWFFIVLSQSRRACGDENERYLSRHYSLCSAASPLLNLIGIVSANRVVVA